MKVIVDLIPGYTSENHTWFKESNSNGNYKNYYIRKENSTEPPNNWVCQTSSILDLLLKTKIYFSIISREVFTTNRLGQKLLQTNGIFTN